MHQRGKFVIVLMFLLAFGMSGYAWWHRYHENPKCKEFWGPRALVAIQRATTVEFFALSTANSQATNNASPNADLLTIDGKPYTAVYRDIHDVPGLVHARHALIDDNSFVWSAPRREDHPIWDFGLRFRDGSEQVTIVFEKSGEGILWLEQQKTIQLVPLSAKAFHKKRNDWEKTPQR